MAVKTFMNGPTDGKHRKENLLIWGLRDPRLISSLMSVVQNSKFIDLYVNLWM